jgi:hypothetical protein
MFRNSGADTTGARPPAVPVTVTEYWPAGDAPNVVTVSDNVAVGVAEFGLIKHVGKLVVVTLEVTAQVNATVPTLGSPPRSIPAVATPPESTAAGVSVLGVSVNDVCP